jgi:hypothetical protein
MALSEKYGALQIPKIGADEPVFVLRAQDRLAAAAIKMYAALAASHGSAVAGSLEQEVLRFQQWNGNKKLPD